MTEQRRSAAPPDMVRAGRDAPVERRVFTGDGYLLFPPPSTAAHFMNRLVLRLSSDSEHGAAPDVLCRTSRGKTGSVNVAEEGR